jgi:site-specific DNA recombinase
MLANPAYMGQAAYGKSESMPRNASLRPRRHATETPRHAKSSGRRRPPEQWISIPVPALVSPEIFAAARDQLERNQKLAARNARGARYLLQGLVVCAGCEYAYYGRTVSPSRPREGRSYAYYQCSEKDHVHLGKERACHNRPVRVDALDAYVWGVVRETLEDPARVLDEWAHRAETDRVQTERRAQRDAAVQVVTQYERSLTRLLDAYEGGALELPELTTRSERLKTQLSRARDALKTAETLFAEVVTLRAVASRLEDFAARVRAGLDQISWLERRSLIRLLVARIEIDTEGATIVVRVPPSPVPEGPGPTETAPDGKVDAVCQLRCRRVVTYPRVFAHHA